MRQAWGNRVKVELIQQCEYVPTAVIQQWELVLAETEETEKQKMVMNGASEHGRLIDR